MAWAEREASSAAQASGVSDAEIWLAVQEANNAARSLYEGLGFVSDEGGLRLGHAVMRKSVPAAAAVTGDPRPRGLLRLGGGRDTIHQVLPWTRRSRRRRPPDWSASSRC